VKRDAIARRPKVLGEIQRDNAEIAESRLCRLFKQALALKPDNTRAQYNICKAYVQITDTYSKKKSVLDEEMAKLRKLDPKLADELEQYRKTYHGGIMTSPLKTDQ